MERYEVIVAGTTVNIYNTKEEAEERLNEVKNSFLAMVHPIDCMYIKKVKKVLDK